MNLHGTERSTDGVAFIAGLGEIASGYDLLLCDVWGVLHNGVAARRPACDALERFRAGGGRVVLVSNAPRPGASVAQQLDGFGVARGAYDAVVTSGDLTRAAVIARSDKVVHHLGPDRDLPLYAGLDLRFGAVEAADYVVCSGLVDDETETPDDYRPVLERMRARTLWMICANPDIVVERGERLIPCAGALGALYEAMGGEVHYPGKPHRPVYEAALAEGARRLGRSSVAPARVLAVGDAIRTDIAGAVRFGIDSLLIARGIHAAELGAGEGTVLEPGRVRAWLGAQAARPKAVLEELIWA